MPRQAQLQVCRLCPRSDLARARERMWRPTTACLLMTARPCNQVVTFCISNVRLAGCQLSPKLCLQAVHGPITPAPQAPAGPGHLSGVTPQGFCPGHLACLHAPCCWACVLPACMHCCCKPISWQLHCAALHVMIARPALSSSTSSHLAAPLLPAPQTGAMWLHAVHRLMDC